MEEYCDKCNEVKDCNKTTGYDIHWCNNCIDEMQEDNLIFQCEQCNQYYYIDDKIDCEDINICNNCYEENKESRSYSRDYYLDNDEGDDPLHD